MNQKIGYGDPMENSYQFGALCSAFCSSYQRSVAFNVVVVNAQNLKKAIQTLQTLSLLQMRSTPKKGDS
ncbi:unnamed protein product [Medioppia subpectinata]|uniref:Uncharacterized protein n=1 Tax=Medioppia subpectinata TaxID=1979941 RepID=A0A7R9KZM3_9ACAR|nr:unnamed protein product [Medioppia subpectinata]CAG2111642.1 unnamed protein product [Medioppia subpectinata]